MARRWARLVLAHKNLMLGLWLVLAALGAIASRTLPGLLTTSLAVPGSQSAAADARLSQGFGANVEGAFVVVLAHSPARAAALSADDRRLRAAASVIAGATTSSFASSGGAAYATVQSPLGLKAAAAATASLRASLTTHHLARAEVTGAPALQADVTPLLAHDLAVGEVVAGAVAVLVIAAVIGPSLAALIPLLAAAGTVAVALGALWVLAHFVVMVLYVPNLAELIGVGIALDYSLLIVRRHAEHVADGMSRSEAVLATMESAGRTVAWSGLTVAVALSALFVVDVPFIHSLAVAGVLVPLVAVAAALSLQPVLLSLLGSFRRGALSDSASPAWGRFGALAVRAPRRTLVGALVPLVALAIPLGWLQLTPTSLRALPGSLASVPPLAVLSERFAPGLVTPIDVVVTTSARGGALRADVSAATLRLARELLANEDVAVVAIGSRPPYVDRARRDRLMVVVARSSLDAPATGALVGEIRGELGRRARLPAGASLLVGGAPAQGVDFIARVDGAIPIIGAWLGLASLVLLSVSFGSLVLALLAIALDVVAIAAAFGATVAVFRFGAGVPFGRYHVGALEAWVPVFLLAMLFGLSMDYEMFIVRRIREARQAGAEDASAIVAGLAGTGRVVSAAACIMVGALFGLYAGSVAGLQELGVGLALGVLIDASVVRALVLPAAMALLGRFAWWLPGRPPPRGAPAPPA
ncbi:MAG: MMPL family transporter [Actinomycetota bacterium]|nr:MMPL family transporter [Actinomycetota bacterium]